MCSIVSSFLYANPVLVGNYFGEKELNTAFVFSICNPSTTYYFHSHFLKHTFSVQVQELSSQSTGISLPIAHILPIIESYFGAIPS